MTYSEMLAKGIAMSQMSLSQVCLKLAQRDIWMDRAILSKLRNGRITPAKDNVNIALADVIGIDSVKLRLAAVKEIIDPELFGLIVTAGAEELISS